MPRPSDPQGGDGDSEFDQACDDDRSTSEDSFIELLEQQNEATEPLWLVLIGHGTFDGRAARFNLSGPDLAAAELADLVSAIKRPVAIINCTSCSSPFINAMSGKDRVVITIE